MIFALVQLVMLVVMTAVNASYTCSGDDGQPHDIHCVFTDVGTLVTEKADASAHSWFAAAKSAHGYSQAEARDQFGCKLPDTEFWRFRVADHKRNRAELYFYHELEVSTPGDYSSITGNVFTVAYKDDFGVSKTAVYIVNYWPTKSPLTWDSCECT